MANLCTVGHNGTATAEMRTLVLRDVGEDLAIFINSTSPKWSPLSHSVSVLTYWPSIQAQFRILANTSSVAEDFVADSWQLRPDPPKRMDWFYSTVKAQSSRIESREQLLEEVAAVELPDPLVAPQTARGLILSPYLIERLDLSQDNGIHDRMRYEKRGDTWVGTTLVP
ncbi:MAG: hypothetical protein GKR90_21390 [Pseudomonadales bacterium]|nr:hypothetical protein [Pseudomonadales bacterium]